MHCAVELTGATKQHTLLQRTQGRYHMIRPNESHGDGPLRGDELIQFAYERVGRGLAPPPEIYRIEYRRCVDWSKFPPWAQPVDPEVFNGSCHEG